MAIVINIMLEDKIGKVKIKEDPVTIGRSRKCDIVLKDNKISGKHCEIFLLDGKATVKDLDSSNGTYIDNSLIEDSFLFLKQKLKIGNFILWLDKDSMTPAERDQHTRQSVKKVSNKVLDINEGLKERSIMASEVLKNYRQSRILINRRHLKKEEKEKFSVPDAEKAKNHLLQKEALRDELKNAVSQSRKNRKKHQKESLLSKISKMIIKKP